jgi:hypothetical protein
VHGLPIPGDWHAEAVEWLGLLKTAKTARERYVAMEWGAGWAPWLVVGATAARHLGVTESRLYGIEADPVHFSAMHQHFVDNDLPPERHVFCKLRPGPSTVKRDGRGIVTLKIGGVIVRSEKAIRKTMIILMV